MSELYVYYKLRQERTQAALSAFRLACAGAPVRLLQRRDETDAALLTWMEVYGADVQDQASVQARLAAALAPFLEGARHIERFEAVA